MSGRADDDDLGLHRLGDVADRVARSYRPGSARASVSVFGLWAEAVGPSVAAHAEPISLDDGCLVVAVDQPAWATQLRYLEPQVRARLTEALGAEVVTSIEVRVRPRSPR